MKIRQQIYITNLDEFLEGNYRWSLTIVGTEPDKPEIDGYIHIGEVWLDVDVPREELHEKAIANLDKAAEEVKADAARKLEQIAAKKQELLAIEYQEAV